MGWRRYFASFLQFCAVFSLLCLGASLFLLPELPEVRYRLAHILWETPALLRQAAFAVLSFGLLLAVGFYTQTRGQYLEIRMGPDRAQFRLPLVRKMIRRCLKDSFSKEVALEEVAFERGGRLSVGVRLVKGGPLLQVLEEKVLLQSLEGKLETLLRARFGYAIPFSLLLRSTKKGAPDPALSSPAPPLKRPEKPL